MQKFIVTRYLVFALFIVLDVIISTVAAWNLGAAQNADIAFQVDSYLIATAVLNVLIIFPLMFVELVRKGAFTTKVWFELAWVAVFWIMHLGGAAAVTALRPQKSCSVVAFSASLEDVCTSTIVLLVFTWFSTVLLLLYLITLFVSAAMHMSEIPRIWNSGVRDVEWFASQPRKIKSAPSTPVLPVFVQHGGKLPLYTVQTRQVNVVTRSVPEPVQEKYLPVKPASGPMPPRPPAIRTLTTLSSSSDTTPPLYPSYVQPLMQVQSVVPVGSSPPSGVQWPSPSPPVPAPLEQSRTTPSSSAPSSPEQTIPRVGLKPLLMQTSAPPRVAPRGPRAKHRPPPLDLSELSSFQSSGQRPARAARK